MSRVVYTEDTLEKVYEALFAAGICLRTARAAVNNMQDAGILFRERIEEPKERSLKKGCHTERNLEHNTTQ